jgi:hypothetical protein
MSYLWLEVFGAQEYYEKEEVTSKADTIVHNFLGVPLKLETCLAFGLVLSVDSFLYAVTFLPMRVIYSAFLASTSFIYPRCGAIHTVSGNTPPHPPLRPVLYQEWQGCQMGDSPAKPLA